MSRPEGSDDDWDLCAHCGQPLGQSPEERLDEHGDPFTARGVHARCVAAYMQQRLRSGPRATVRMYREGDDGPL